MSSAEPVLFPVLIDAATDPLVKAVAAYLARYRAQTRVHTESDLRASLVWCRERDINPLKASRAQIELYVRWMQEVRHFQPSTVSRRVSVVVGFYRTCVIDQVLAQSPADYVRRPNVPPESPTLGLSHLQFEALLSAARTSGNTNDFALVTMLGLLGLRIFEACGANRRMPDDLARRPDRMLQLVASHRPTTASTFARSDCGNNPPNGDTSRICTESVSRPVITRRSPGTSRCSTNTSHRPRFDT